MINPPLNTLLNSMGNAASVERVLSRRAELENARNALTDRVSPVHKTQVCFVRITGTRRCGTVGPHLGATSFGRCQYGVWSDA